LKVNTILILIIHSNDSIYMEFYDESLKQRYVSYNVHIHA